MKKTAARKTRKASTLETSFLRAWELVGDKALPPEREFHFALPDRRWRFDLAWPSRLVAVEIQGGQFMAKGGHSNVKGIDRDCEKSNWATLRGWRVLKFSTKQVTGAPVQCVETVLAALQTEPRFKEPVQVIQPRLF